MSSRDSFSPRTVEQRLPLPLNGTIYTTTRQVAPEKETPLVGATMAAELGPAWADSLVISVQVQPQGSQDVLVIMHARIPSEADQLASNWEQTEVPIGNFMLPGVVRTVILLASAYQDDAPVIGSAMPTITDGLFHGDGYILYDRECVRSGMQLEPVFRLDRRVFVKKSTSTANDFDEALGGNLQTIQTLYYRGETVTGFGTAQTESVTVVGTVTVPVFASRVLNLAVQPTAGEIITIGATVFEFVSSVVDATDVLIGGDLAATQAALVVAVNAAGIGTLSDFTANAATFTTNVAGTAGNSIASTTTMTGIGNGWAGANLTGGVNSGAGNLTFTTTSTAVTGSPVTVTFAVAAGDTAAQVAAKGALALDANAAVYAAWFTSVDGATVRLTRRVVDTNDAAANLALAIPGSGGAAGITPVAASTNGTSVVTSLPIEQVFALSANSYWGVQGDFTAREGRQLSNNWFLVTTRQLTPTAFAAGGRTYNTTEDHLWPAVLSSIGIDTWTKAEGGSEMYLQPFYSREAYRGPCRATVVERFYINSPIVNAPQVMLPLPINVQTPIAGINIGPTLHDNIPFFITNGTEDPVYDYINIAFNFPATNFSDWPASVIAYDQARPFRGGYLRTTVTIYQPHT
jgi:hypothetical protein